MKSTWRIPFAIIFAGILIATAIYYVYVSKSNLGVHTLENVSLLHPVGVQDHILGNPLAKVTIIEYSDFSCEFCKGFNEVLKQIIEENGVTGNVAWVFREFPLVEIHPEAMKDAEAAECAGVVGGNDTFWKFENALFIHQSLDPSGFGDLAQSLGIPGSAFAECYSTANKRVDTRINADRQNALDMGATGAPFSIISIVGKTPMVIEGGYSYDAMKQLINEALLEK